MPRTYKVSGTGPLRTITIKMARLLAVSLLVSLGASGALAQSFCRCNYGPSSWIPICGTDGRTYTTICDLNAAQQTNFNLGIRGLGQCDTVNAQNDRYARRCPNSGTGQQTAPPPVTQPPLPTTQPGNQPPPPVQPFSIGRPQFPGRRKRQVDTRHGGGGGYSDYYYGSGYGPSYGYGNNGYNGYPSNQYYYYQQPYYGNQGYYNQGYYQSYYPSQNYFQTTVCFNNGTTVTTTPDRIRCAIATNQGVGVRCYSSCSACANRPICPVPQPGASTPAPVTIAPGVVAPTPIDDFSMTQRIFDDGPQ